ncbi:MAG: bacteriohemerythrin [Proteobacteria bacterium]|nr:bacteriohemerythrin [Pseudomonadota bacterium]
MPLIEWDASLETGIGMIDAQHRILVDLINKLDASVQEGSPAKAVELVLVDLKKYTVYHFSAEETLMVRSGYAGFEAHRDQHQEFMEEVDGFEIDSLTGAPDVAQDVLEFLKDWLTNHIRVSDKDFAAAQSA